MPCGGIWPNYTEGTQPGRWCFGCGKKDNRTALWSYVEEWDADIHDDCIDEFLKGPEGRIVLSHGHEVERRKP